MMTQLRVGPLVRATTADSTVIWLESSEPGDVVVTATPLDEAAPGGAPVPTAPVPTATARTVLVGSRHYAAPQLTGLQPATWYRYTIQITNHQSGSRQTVGGQADEALPLQCFRTLDRPDERRPVSLAYGSCRRALSPRRDVLGAFGAWLVRHYAERETLWPRLLLLIGDQIYADEPGLAAIRVDARLRGGATTFAELASLYEFAWTRDKNVRQALAVLPSYMICDDHEVTNGWNTLPFWRAAMLKRGHEQLLVDGLVAYWIYQGWGNLLSSSHSEAGASTSAPDPRLHIMDEAARSGEDALEALRSCVRRAVHGETRLRWYYSIPMSPPLFVCDARADREARFHNTPDSPGVEVPTRIVSHEQMADIEAWLRAHDDGPAILVSSVPILLPPLIGLSEYVMGKRLGQQSDPGWRVAARLLARLQQRIAYRTQFDHWPVFAETWHELVEVLATRRHAVIALSGDVHFSYTMDARLTKAADSRVHLHQFVCSPLENRLGQSTRRKITVQSVCRRAAYGGLRTRVRPLHSICGPLKANAQNRIHNDLLLGNTLALLTFERQNTDQYEIRQEYLGSRDGQLVPVAYSVMRA